MAFPLPLLTRPQVPQLSYQHQASGQLSRSPAGTDGFRRYMTGYTGNGRTPDAEPPGWPLAAQTTLRGHVGASIRETRATGTLIRVTTCHWDPALLSHFGEPSAVGVHPASRRRPRRRPPGRQRSPLPVPGGHRLASATRWSYASSSLARYGSRAAGSALTAEAGQHHVVRRRDHHHGSGFGCRTR
jgi:hypothetical protein